MSAKQDLSVINFCLFLIGMFAVWHITHDGWVLFWTFIAALHITTSSTKRKSKRGKELE